MIIISYTNQIDLIILYCYLVSKIVFSQHEITMIDVNSVKSFNHDIFMSLEGDNQHDNKLPEKSQVESLMETCANSFLRNVSKLIPLIRSGSPQKFNKTYYKLKFHHPMPNMELKQLINYLKILRKGKIKKVHLHELNRIVTILISKIWLIIITLMTLAELWHAFQLFKIKGNSSVELTANEYNNSSLNCVTRFNQFDLKPFVLSHLGFRFSPLNKMGAIVYCSTIYFEIPLLLGYALSILRQQTFSFSVEQILHCKNSYLAHLHKEASKFLQAIDEMRMSIENALIYEHEQTDQAWPPKPQLCDECSTLLFDSLIDSRPKRCKHGSGYTFLCSMLQNNCHEMSTMQLNPIISKKVKKNKICLNSGYHSTYCHLIQFMEPLPTKNSHRKLFVEMRIIVITIIMLVGMLTLIMSNYYTILYEIDSLYQAGLYLVRCNSKRVDNIPKSISHLFMNKKEMYELIELIQSFEVAYGSKSLANTYSQLEFEQNFQLLKYFIDLYVDIPNLTFCLIINAMHIYSLIWFCHGWCNIMDFYLMTLIWSKSLQAKLHHCTNALRKINQIEQVNSSSKLSSPSTLFNADLHDNNNTQSNGIIPKTFIWPCNLEETSEENNRFYGDSFLELAYAKLESIILLACCEFNLYREAQFHNRNFNEYFSIVCYAGIAIMIYLMRTTYADELLQEGTVTIPFMILLMFSGEIFLIVSISKTNCYKRINASLNDVLANIGRIQLDKQRYIVKMLRRHILYDRQIDVLLPTRLLGLTLAKSTFITFNYYLSGGLLYYIMRR